MADRGYVLESGRLVIDGKSEDLIDNEKVTKVFLGKLIKKQQDRYLVYQ